MNRLLTRGLLTNSRSVLQPVRPGLRQLASPVNVQRITIARRSSEEVPEHEGGSIQKVIFGGIFGCVFIAYLISICSQLPEDPERMTVEKQKRMTQKELEEYDQAQRAKQWYEAIGDMFPAGWRWKQALETVVAESMNIESWFGLKLGLDYYLSSTEPEWKIALPPPLEPPYPQTRFTISMEILGLLFESNFDPVRGWAFKPRPGAEYFMSKVGFPNSELVFFTEASGQDILPIIDRFAKKLQRHFKTEQPPMALWQLYRNSCRYDDGNYKKDIDVLGRDPKTTIHIDISDTAFLEKHKDNVILVPSAKQSRASGHDMTLFDLGDLLEDILNDRDIYDVREKIVELRSKGKEGQFLTDIFREIQAENEFKESELQAKQAEINTLNPSMAKRNKFKLF